MYLTVISAPLLWFLLSHMLLYLAFQHPFVRKVTSNRALRELVAEAKAEVLEEIEDSRDEAEDDDSSESASVSAALPAPCHTWHRVGRQWVKSPQPGCRRLNLGLFLDAQCEQAAALLGPLRWMGKQFCDQGGASFQWLPRTWGNNGAGRWPSCPFMRWECTELLLWAGL